MRRAIHVAMMGLGMLAGIGAVWAADALSLAPAALFAAEQADRSNVSGIASDATGKPLAGADVLLCYLRYDDPRSGVVARSKTGTDGAFRFEKAIAWEPPSASTNTNIMNPPRYAVVVKDAQQGIAFEVITKQDPTDGLVIQTQGRTLHTLHVMEHSGKPVAGAKVFLSDAQRPRVADREEEYARWSIHDVGDLGISSGVTDATGTVELAGTPGECSFRAVKEGYAQGCGSSDILMSPGASISGRITMEDGTPAAGAAVVVRYLGNGPLWSEAVLTDDQGNYLATGVPLSGYVCDGAKPESAKDVHGAIAIDATDLRPGSSLMARGIEMPARAQEQGKSHDLTLIKACLVSGQVVDLDSRRPVAGATFGFSSRFEDRWYSTRGMVRADDQGRFRFLAMPGSEFGLVNLEEPHDGRYIVDNRINANADWAHALDGKTVRKDMTDVVLEPRVWDGQQLTGRVVNAKGEPVGDADVFITARVHPVQTDAQGVFTLKSAPKDRDISLCAVSKDKSLAAIVKLPRGSTQTTMELKPTIACDGIVTTPSGLPADNLTFAMEFQFNGEGLYGLREELVTDAQGRFRVSHLIPGISYEVSWSSDDETNRDYGRDSTTVDMKSLKPDEPIRFQANKYINALIGKVIGPDGKPIEAAVIDIGESSLVPEDVRYGGHQAIMTDKNGEFTATRLGDGELTIIVRAEGFRDGTFTSRTDAVDFVAKLRARTEPPIHEAMIVDSQGKAMPDIPVTLILHGATDESKPVSIVAKSDASGVARFKTPEPAAAPSTQESQDFRPAILMCDVEGYDLASVQGPEDGDLLAHFVLHKSGSAWQGRLVGPDDKPLANVEVTVIGITMRDGDGLGAGTSFSELPVIELLGNLLKVTSDAQGRFSLPRIPTAAFIWLSIPTPPGLCPLDDASFGSGDDDATTPKTFRFVKAARLKGRVVLKGSGKPIQTDGKAFVSLTRDDHRRGDGGATLGDDGAFEQENLIPGRYNVTVNGPSERMRSYLMAEPVSVMLSGGQETQVVVEMVEGIPVPGKFLAMPKTGEALVRIYRATDGKAVSTARAKEDGSFEFYVAEPGEYHIGYIAEGTSNWTPSDGVKIEAGKPIEPVIIDQQRR